VPPPLMGWTVKIYHKAGGDVVSHHRLVECSLPTLLIGTQLWSTSVGSIPIR
jgi:hypothetical protein